VPLSTQAIYRAIAEGRGGGGRLYL
jgi:hypothetical protein